MGVLPAWGTRAKSWRAQAEDMREVADDLRHGAGQLARQWTEPLKRYAGELAAETARDGE